MSRPDVVVVVLSSARADHLSCYGYGRDTTPFLDTIVAEGTLFQNTFSPAPWALPANASILTGLYPSVHGATDENPSLAEEHGTLFELFSQRGYATAAFSSNHWLSPATGFGRSVDAFFTAGSDSATALPVLAVRKAFDVLRGRRDSGALRTNRAMARWISGLDRSTPMFAYIHLSETQLRYRPPDGFRQLFLEISDTPARVAAVNQDPIAYLAGGVAMGEEEFRILGALYDAALRYADSRIEMLVEELTRFGRWRNTVFVVMGDHGENLGDHGLMSHKFSLHETVLRVPLVLRGPGVPHGGRSDGLAQTVDVFPTLAGLAGIEPELFAPVDGRALIDDTRLRSGRDFVFAERRRPNLSAIVGKYPDFDTGVVDVRRRSVSDGRLKLIWREDGAHELFDLVADPAEAVNLASEMPESVARLENVLEDWAVSLGEGAAEELEPEGIDIEHLAGLGYID